MYRGYHMSMEDIEGHLPPPHASAMLNGIGGHPPWEEDPNKINVFVYGSLLKGFSNSYLLKDAKFVGQYVTEKRYKMISYGQYPAVQKAIRPKDDKPSTLVAQRSQYRPIVGEVYKVDLKTLARLDILEGNGQFYERELIPIQGFNEKTWMYILTYYDDSAPLVELNSDRNYSWRSEMTKVRLGNLLKQQRTDNGTTTNAQTQPKKTT